MGDLSAVIGPQEAFTIEVNEMRSYFLDPDLLLARQKLSPRPVDAVR
jgi:hypothetical protein